MDSIEEEIINEEFDGLHNREARKKLARERFFEGREAAEVRELATAVALKKVGEERVCSFRMRADGTANVSRCFKWEKLTGFMVSVGRREGEGKG